jgi:hypothetical protein
MITFAKRRRQRFERAVHEDAVLLQRQQAARIGRCRGVAIDALAAIDLFVEFEGRVRAAVVAQPGIAALRTIPSSQGRALSASVPR